MSIWPTRPFHITRAEVRKTGAASQAVLRPNSRPASAKTTSTEPMPASSDGRRAATSSTPPRRAPNRAMFQKWSGGLWSYLSPFRRGTRKCSIARGSSSISRATSA